MDVVYKHYVGVNYQFWRFFHYIPYNWHICIMKVPS